MHSIYYGYSIPSFVGIWIRNDNRDLNYELRNQSDFEVPRARTESFKKLPLYSLPVAWNNIGDLKFQTNKITFLNCLTDYYYYYYFSFFFFFCLLYLFLLYTPFNCISVGPIHSFTQLFSSCFDYQKFVLLSPPPLCFASPAPFCWSW